MATIDNYKIVLDVQGQQAVDRLSKSLGGLGSTIAGIGFAAFTNSVLQMADAVSDLAAATGLSIGNIAAFGGALGQAGGKAEDAGKMIGKFFQTLDDAAGGSDKAQEALQRVGLQLSDLTTMSEGELLNEAIRKLGEMEAGAKRTALGMEIFGKSFKSIDPKVLAEAFATGDFSKAQDSLEKMGKLADSLAANFYTLQMAGAQVFSDMASAIEPFIGKIEDGRLSLDQAEKIIKAVGIGLALAFGAKTVSTIIDIVTVVKSLTTALKGTVIVQTALTALSGPKGWAMIAGGAVAAAAAIYGLNKALEGTNEEMEKATGAGTPDSGKKKGPAYAAVKMSAKDKAASQAAVAAMGVTAQMQLQNEEANKLRQITIDTIGMEANFANLIKSNAQARATASNDILDLENKIRLEKQKGEDSNPKVIAELQKQIGLKKDQLTATLGLNQAEYARLQAVQKFTTSVNTDAMLASRQLDLDLMKQQIDFGTAITLQDQTQLKILALANEEAKKRIDLEKELTLARASGNQVAIDDVNKRMAADVSYYENRRKLIEQDAAAQIANRENVAMGVEKAMEQIARSMDPIKLAEEATLGLFSKMNDAITQLVTTGKVSFGELAKSFGQMILQMMLKQQAARAASAAGSFLTNLFSGLFKAEGGPVKGNQPYIVGEKGPELFVPPGAGKIIPNNQMASKGVASGAVSAPITNTYITNNISALDSKSVAQLFAENRRTLFGSVQMAQKEMSYSR
jgi:lambda family phage tail tape measure protein